MDEPQPQPQRTTFGEDDSPEAVYRREWRPLYGLIYRAVRRRDDAHDLTQEVFARALPTLDRAPPGVRARAFLKTIARNLLRDRWRRRDPEFVALDDRDLPADTTDDPLDLALSAAQREALRRALAALPTDYRRVLLLRIVEGRPMAEVAAAFGRKPDAIRQLQHRALVALRDRMREEIEP